MNFYSLKEYLINEYGHPLYKLSLSCSNTCPNRDGTKGTGGCIFCSQKGSGDFASPFNMNIDSQIEEAKELINKKYKGDKYIAYFGTFTSTYGDISKLKEIFLSTINRNDIEILSIATRPDCLNDDVINMLKELNTVKPVWIELGLQTLNENTAKLINRCYENIEYFKAIEKLKSINIKIITHVILGLPGETKNDMINTVKSIANITDGIKFTVLHILKNTKLLDLYKNGEYTPMSLEQYADILGKCIMELPKSVVVHRITGDGNKKELVAPMWTANKKYVLQYLYDYFKNNEIKQKM